MNEIPRRWKMASPGAVLALEAAASTVKFFYLIWAYAANLFYFDLWDFLTPFLAAAPALSIS